MNEIKIIFKSILECLKILLWCAFIGILIILIKKFFPIVLWIALPVVIIILFKIIYDSNKEIEKGDK